MRTLPTGHGRLCAQNTHLGIAGTVTEPASTAAPIGGYRVLRGRAAVTVCNASRAAPA
jgi:hypothetical protein